VQAGFLYPSTHFYKQFVVALATAFFSGTLYSGIVVWTQTTSGIDYLALVIFWASIIAVFVWVYIRMKWKVDEKDAMLEVVLDHDCIDPPAVPVLLPNGCRSKHYPHH
jgi:hypothetical protein